MPVKFQWFGEDVKKTIGDNTEQQVNDVADNILKDAEKNAPVEISTTNKKRRPGSLKKSGRVVKFKKYGIFGAYIKFGGIIVNGVKVFYAAFVDLGTPGTYTETGEKRTAIKSDPFLRNSLKNNKRKLLKIKKI